MKLIQPARWLIAFHRSNTRLLNRVTERLFDHGYQYSLFLKVPIEYRGIIYLRVWPCTVPWFLVVKGILQKLTALAYKNTAYWSKHAGVHYSDDRSSPVVK